MRPRLLLVDSEASFRQRAIGALSERLAVTVPAPGEDVVRLARAVRPDVGCFACGGRSRVEALRLARVLKTDVRIVPSLGFTLRSGEGAPSRAAVESVHVDGLLLGAEDPAALVSFVEALLSGAHVMPEPWPAEAPGSVRRLLTRLLGRGGGD